MGKIFRFKRKQYSFTKYQGRGKPYPTDKNGNELPRPRWEYDNSLPKIIEISYNKTYESDMAKLILPEDKRRVKQLIGSLKQGYIFDNNPNDQTEYTHRLGTDKYVYSKDINGKDRLTYRISKPEILALPDSTSLVMIKVTIDHAFGHQGNFKGISKTYSNNEE